MTFWHTNVIQWILLLLSHGADSFNTNPPGVTSKQHISVTISVTHLAPVSGRVHFFKILDY